MWRANLQSFGEQRLCRGKVAFCQSHHAQVDQHHLKGVEITVLATQTRALHRRGSDPVKIALEQTAERPSLEQHHRRWHITFETGRHGFSLVDQAPRRWAVAGHTRGKGCHGERPRDLRNRSSRSSLLHGAFQCRSGSVRIALQDAQESA